MFGTGDLNYSNQGDHQVTEESNSPTCPSAVVNIDFISVFLWEHNVAGINAIRKSVLKIIACVRESPWRCITIVTL